MKDPLGYEGRKVVVTGAASGMGQAAATILAELGAKVVALDYKPVTVAVEQSLSVDLRDRDSIDAAVKGVGEGVDAVFSCAGLPGPPFSDLDTVVVNFVGARHLVESLVPVMPSGSGVACVASAAAIGWQQAVAALRPLVESPTFEEGKAWLEAHPDAVGYSAYAFSKQVMNAWVSWRAADLIEQGIRLNCINPGPTDTPMMPAFHELAGKELVDLAVGPIGRYSTAEEQAWALVLLNSPRLSYVTGEVFNTDGGFTGAVLMGRQKGWGEYIS
jgi:NAD(P)-dependent dehydrogenase (short-subunit alcohol dehydrogenase family)